MTDKQIKKYFEENDLDNIETLMDEYESEKEMDAVKEEVITSEKKEEKSILKEILFWIRDLAITVCIVLLILTFVGETTSIIGGSMEPQIYDGDRFIINKISYAFGAPDRFDIVVFPFDEDYNYIKRVIGLPGETLELIVQPDETYDIYIDGVLLEESYGKEAIIRPGNQNYPVEIPEGYYFVMGDNRNDSSDSRYTDVGLISEEDIIGKTWIRIWPFSGFGGVE